MGWLLCAVHHSKLIAMYVAGISHRLPGMCMDCLATGFILQCLNWTSFMNTFIHILVFVGMSVSLFVVSSYTHIPARFKETITQALK